MAEPAAGQQPREAEGRDGGRDDRQDDGGDLAAIALFGEEPQRLDLPDHGPGDAEATAATLGNGGGAAVVAVMAVMATSALALLTQLAHRGTDNVAPC